MRRPIIIAYLLFISVVLFSEDDFIGLSNKKSNNEKDVIEKIENKKTDNIDENFKNKSILPKSFYIGDLGDFKSIDINRNSVLEFVESFMESIKNGEELKELSPLFKFIFNESYKDTLLKKRKEITHWYLGNIHLEENRAWVKIEVHFREKILSGVIYLENNSEWFITDLQLQNQEKGFFDPSSSNSY